jgi:hypothetical protein
MLPLVGGVSLQDVTDWVAGGNPLYAFGRLARQVGLGGVTFADAFRVVMTEYLVFHAVAAIAFAGLAVANLRRRSAFLDGPPPVKRRLAPYLPPRPRVGDRPVLWRELYAAVPRKPFGRALARLRIVLAFAPLAWIVIMVVTMSTTPTARNVVMAVGVYVRLAGAVAVCGGAIFVMQRAVTSLQRERQRKTLDELRLTDLTPAEVYDQKWWGAVLSQRQALIVVGLHWLLALVIGAMHPLAVLLLAFATLLYAAYAASAGMYCAAHFRRPNTCRGVAGLLVFGLGALPLMLGLWAEVYTPLGRKSLWGLAFFGASPPVLLGFGGFSASELAWVHSHNDYTTLVWGGAFGLAACSALTVWLWRAGRRRMAAALRQE